MNDISQQNTRIHNTVVIIITIGALSAIVESITQGWEFWVPPLIAVGLVACWVMHILQYRQSTFRETYYLIFAMLMAFYHGVHETSFFDLVIVSVLLMVTVTLLRRPVFLNILLADFFVMVIMHLFMGISNGTLIFDPLTVSRILLHVIIEMIIFRVLHDVIRNDMADTRELERRNAEKMREKSDMEDFLVNISHELRTPVNVINGLSAIIMKKEDRDDVASINDAGIRLGRQIDDIQNYSEIQRGDVILEEGNYMITSMINDIMAGYSYYQKDSGKDLVVDLDPNVPSVMYGDAGRINKILGHLLDNAFKFTPKGAVYLRISTIKHADATNLVIEVTDSGIGMSADEIAKINDGMYQSSRGRDRSTGGIGLGLPIVYGFVRCMNGFIRIESEKNKGTGVFVTLTQTVVDPTPCLALKSDIVPGVVFHFDQQGRGGSKTPEFYRKMAANIAQALRINMYFAASAGEVLKLTDRGDITHVFVGEKEYAKDRTLYDTLSEKVTVAVSTPGSFVSQNGRIVVIPLPLCASQIIRVLNGEAGIIHTSQSSLERPVFDGVKALVVDDEPMNLIVARGLFKEYNMSVDTADSGAEALRKFTEKDYDVVFMDHMMPQMDGVEAMKRIKDIALQQQKTARVIALTANVVSGAKEMFMREGFAGFIGKPIDINEFERTMCRVLPGMTHTTGERGERA